MDEIKTDIFEFFEVLNFGYIKNIYYVTISIIDYIG